MTGKDSPLYRIHRDTPVRETMLLLAMYDAGYLYKVNLDYKAGLDAQWDHSHGWHSNDDDDLEAFTDGVNTALGMDDE